MPKCKICSKELDKKTAYIIHGKPNKYYCTEEEFNLKIIKDNEIKKIYAALTDILEYQYLPPIYVKKFKELLEMYEINIIYETIKQSKESIKYSNTKTFSNEFQKASYVNTIIKNNIEKIKKEVIDIEKYKHKQDIKAVNIDLINEQQTKNKIILKNDIMEFIKEDI